MKNLCATTAMVVVLTLSAAFASAQEKDAKDDAQPSLMEETIAGFPAADATKFRDTMKQAHDKNMSISNQIHSLHDELDVIMSTEPFDQIAFNAKSEKLRVYTNRCVQILIKHLQQLHLSLLLMSVKQ